MEGREKVTEGMGGMDAKGKGKEEGGKGGERL